MKPSTTKLGKMLHELGVVDRPFTATDLKKGTGPKGVSDETYGKDSRIYIHCEDKEARHKLERELKRKGVTTVDKKYWPSGNTVDVGVTFFKGWHHNE